MRLFQGFAPSKGRERETHWFKKNYTIADSLGSEYQGPLVGLHQAPCQDPDVSAYGGLHCCSVEARGDVLQVGNSIFRLWNY